MPSCSQHRYSHRKDTETICIRWMDKMWCLSVRFSGGAVVKNPPAKARDTGHTSSAPGSGSSPGEGKDNSLQYSCLGNPMDRGAWRATVHGLQKSQTWLSDWTTTYQYIYNGILLSHFKKDETMAFAETWMDINIIILSEVSVKSEK